MSSIRPSGANVAAYRPRRHIASVVSIAGLILVLALAACGSPPKPASAVSSPARTSALARPVATATASPTAAPAAPTGFSPLALTFVSPTDGWVIGTGACASCIWIYHTTNGGASWSQSGAPPASYPLGGCYELPTPCVDTLLFATPDRGFAFGANWGDAFMTADGGNTWHALPVTDITAMALAGNDALRLRGADGGCTTGACQLERSTDGGVIWLAAGEPLLTPEGLGGDVLLQDDGHAYAVGYGNPAGGGPETAELYRSSNFGLTWTHEDDPCSSRSGVRPIALRVASSADGVVAIDCLANRAGSSQNFVIVSTDGGALFHTQRSAPSSFGAFAVGSASVLAVETPAGLSVSHNGGETWAATYSCPAENTANTGISFVGFETPSVAHLICGDAVARSTDGGLSWTTYRFAR